MNATRYPQYVRLAFLALLVAGAVSAAHGEVQPQPSDPATHFDTYKSPQCGCCADWVTHMQEAGFSMRVNENADLNSIKEQLGIQPRLQSCHTAVHAASNSVFEGHIPASLIRRYLAEQPAGARGLAVPGMPVGSPGMEIGDRRDSYDVLLIMEDGSTPVYTRIEGDH